MAINNGRQVVTGGYIDQNGNIIEETQWVPQQTYSPDHIMGQINSLLDGTKTPAQVRVEDNIYASNPTMPSTTSNYSNVSSVFSPAETYKFRSDGYYNQGDTALGDAWKSLADGLGKYSSEANATLSGYNSLLDYIKSNETGLQNVSSQLYGQLASDIQSQKDYVNQMFGPNGELTQEVNKYYDDLGNYLATDAGRQAATIAAQGIHSGASLGSIRAQQNEAYNESFQRYVQAKEQQINAKQQMASNLINFMSTLRKEYGDTTNQYIIEMYKRAADLYEKTAMSALADINSYNQLRATASGGGSSSSSGNPILDDIINKMNAKQMLMNAGYTEEQADALVGGGTVVDDKGNIVTVSEADKKAAQEKLELEQPKSNSTAAQKKQAIRDANAALQKLPDEAWYTKLGGNLATTAVNLTPNRLIDMFN